MKPVFDIYQYAYGDKEVNKNFHSLIEYIEQNKVALTHNQVAISGRTWADLKIGDILISERGNKITVKRFNAYGHSIDFMSQGMTCLIIAEVTDYEDFKQQQILFL